MELLAAVVGGEEIRANWIWIETTKEEGNIVYFRFFFFKRGSSSFASVGTWNRFLLEPSFGAQK